MRHPFLSNIVLIYLLHCDAFSKFMMTLHYQKGNASRGQLQSDITCVRRIFRYNIMYFGMYRSQEECQRITHRKHFKCENRISHFLLVISQLFCYKYFCKHNLLINPKHIR